MYTYIEIFIDDYKVLWDNNQRNRTWNKKIVSKHQSNLTSTEYSTIKEQLSKNQELIIQQLRRKKTHKYCQLKYGEQIPGKQTGSLSVK